MKKILLFFVMFFPFLSLFAGWGADLCEDVTCSGHGECQEDGEDEWCLCDEGYIADGMNCILGCNGVTCSGHGVCSVVSGAEVCSCEAGFHASGLNCILNEASTVDTLAVLNETDCYNTGNCHYRLIFATGAYDFTLALSSLYDIIVNVLDSGNVWHNYRKTVAQCVTEGVCDNVDAQYIDFWFQHNVNGNQYVTVELLGNGDDAYDDMFHDVLIDYCYGVNCGTGGTCDGTSGYPVCSCDEGYVLRGSICEEGWFEDENLAAAVVELLQYDGYEVETETDIDPEMLEGITHLALRGKNISSLAGIELFSSLAVLDVSENMISDLSPLSNCEELVILNMSGNPANDLSPLSALPLVSLDISYSGVYNINPLVSIETLSELILADMENGRHGIIRPENSTVSEWLLNQEFPGCNKFYFYGSSNSNTFGVGFIETGSNCQAHGSCVNGMCVCDEGYSYSLINNSCYIPNICDAESHPNPATGICEDNKQYIHCGDEPGKKFSYSYLEWNGSEYAFPDGYTNTEPCKIGDGTCDGDNNRSICRWSCETDYTAVGNVCVPRAVREIPDSAYNQLILPHISRQDVSLEPVPGVPSFAPVLNAGFYYSAKKNLEYGWYFDLPRVELNLNERGYTLTSYEWDQKTVYVYMPWGKEEYSIEAEKKCLDSDNYPVDCETSPDIDRLEITYYPAPGQNLFSYVVLETTGEAYGFNFSVDRNDWWKITRYGEDGSVTEFSRNYNKNGNEEVVPRPNFFSFMDYIPISKHVTRDKKETSFSYEWGLVKRMYTQSVHFYYIIRSATIVDPLKRVIKIESSDPELSDSETQEYGLMGRPGSYFLVYTPLEGDVEISVGRADHDGEVIESTLKKVVKYSNIDGFSMDAKIYKDEHLYRKDRYSIDDSNKNLFVLDSYAVISVNSFPLDSSVGRMTWEFTKENDNPDGYVERKLVNSDDPNDPEYIVKTVKGKFYQPRQKIYSSEYSLSYSPLKTETIYSHEKSGSSDKKRIVEDYFTEWLQPAKRWICERDYDDDEKNCDGISNTVSESIKYNVSGSPIYFKNADGQVTVNIYNTTDEVSPGNYIVHFLSDPWNYSNAVNLNVNLPTPDFIRADNLHKTGTLACSSVYSLDTGSVGGMMLNYVAYGITPNSDFCSSSENKRVTNYVWNEEASGKPYDLKTVTYPDGKEQEFTYDYEMTADGVGKIRGETVTGSNNQNTLQTCYKYDNNYQLIEQGIGLPGPDCSKKKGFSFSGEGGLLMTHDYSFDENNTPVLANDYIYDYLGRKLVERNSAGVSTVYVYDSLDRVVFTFFGCNVDNFAFENRVYTPYSFDGDASAGVTGSGVTFDYNSGEFPYARYINLNSCEYYRKYTYDTMSNLTETYFFEYWGVNANNQVVQLDSPKIIKQETEYDMIGRAVKSCQFEVAQPSDKRCIETEHDIFGNIVKKTENGEERVITYDLRNRPLTVTVDGLPTEQYFYHNETCDTYCGYDEIANKYGTTNTLKTYKDRWNRAAKSVDPFGNETVTTYESSYSDNILSQTTTSSSVKTGETTWTYDDLDRKLSETRKQFIPGSESTTNVNHQTNWQYDSIGNVVSVESSDGTKQTYSYDTLNRPVETVNEEYINSNWVETSSSENFYDTQGRLFRTETTRNSQTITEDYGFDTFGRVTAVKTTDPANSSRYRVKFYNTGGQVIWEADEESDADPRDYSGLGLGNVEIGNQKYYTYNAFGDLEKTVYIMTNNGKGFGSIDLNPWLNGSQITTNFTYDIFGRITSRINDRSGVTEYNYYTSNTTGSHRRNKLESIQITPALSDNDLNYTDSDSVAQTYTYTYNDKGDEASVEYTEGNSYSMEVDFTRDDYGRIIGKTSDGSVPVTQTFTYNMRNLLETATDTIGNAAATSVTRLYDSFGNPYSESVSSGNITKTVSRRMTDAKTYQFTYPDGKTLRKTATGNDLDSIEYNNSEIASYNRANGVLTAITKGQNLTETFTYNTWNQLANHTINNANADIYDMSYNYSRGWHLIEKADGIKNTSDKYTYDSYYRLKEVKYDFANNTAARTDNFYQDGVHNIEQSTENGTTFAWGVDKLNRLREKKVGNNTDAAYEYDERNNMISEDRSGTTDDKTYIYDDLNRLIEVKDGSNQTIATYTYDAFNRRITKTAGTTTERYTYDDWDIVEISTNSDDYTNIIDSGTDRHIAIEVTANNTSTLYYFLTDERGNVTALTDESGNILERYRYRVYGDFEILDTQFAPKDCSNQSCYATNLHNFLWGGSLYEPETGLYWMRNRYYHIDMHRFINQDPIGIWGDTNNLGNGFAYVAGMVIEASDPTGLEYTSDDELGKSILAKGNETSKEFRNLNADGNGKIIIVEDGNLPEIENLENVEGACFINDKTYIERTVAEQGKIVKREDENDKSYKLGGIFASAATKKTISYYLSPEAIAAHEMAEKAELEKRKKERAAEKAAGKGNGELTKEDYEEAHKKGIEAEKKVMEEQEEAKNRQKQKEEEEKKNKGGEKYPSDPDNSNDSFQQKLMESMLSKILRDSDFSIYDQGPVVKIQVETVSGNPKWVFVFNPFYRGVDPMKQIFWHTRNADGTKGFVRNPFAPKGEYGYDATTYENWQQSGFIQPNVDPYFN